MRVEGHSLASAIDQLSDFYKIRHFSKQAVFLPADLKRTYKKALSSLKRELGDLVPDILSEPELIIKAVERDFPLPQKK